MNRKERKAIKELDVPPLNLVGSELKYFQKAVVLSLENKNLHVEIGKLRAFIAELEDTEKAAQRAKIKETQTFDAHRKEINKLLAEKAELMKTIHSLEAKNQSLKGKLTSIERKTTKYIKPQ